MQECGGLFGLDSWVFDPNKLFEPEKFRHVITLNMEILSLIARGSLDEAVLGSVAFTLDGQPLYWVARLARGRERPQKISGSDLIWSVAEYAGRTGRSIFLLGDDELTNELAIKELRERFGGDVFGFSPPYVHVAFDDGLNEEIIKMIKEIHPYYLFVAFGAPKQEQWIYQNRVELEDAGVKLVVGVGGSFGFVSGRERRAPGWVQKIGLEWLYRAIQNPKRLVRNFRSLPALGRLWAELWGFLVGAQSQQK